MKQTFEVHNVKCGGCANTLTKSLKDDFGSVEVDLSVNPRKKKIGRATRLNSSH